MIKFENVSKYYGRVHALNDINFELSGSRVVGVLGPNGSGKTTLLKLLQGYLKPTKGKITIFGKEIGPETKSRISYLPDKTFIPIDYKVSEAKALYEKFYSDFLPGKFDELISLMNIDQDKRIRDLSKGMSEKFHLSLILSRDADIYVIDEPIAGVDLVAREEILKAIFSNIDGDKLIIITTHLINELESLFDEVIYIANGRIVLQGDAEALRLEKNKSVSEIFKELFGIVH